MLLSRQLNHCVLQRPLHFAVMPRADASVSGYPLLSCFATMPQIPPTALSDVRILAAYAIFLASYMVFALGKFPGTKIDRTGAAIIGAVAMVAFRIVRPSEALHFIDFGTIVLLFSMMLIVGNLHLVGFFEWNAEAILRRLKPSLLLPAVIFTSGFLSAFFVNDIVCLVMVPFVLSTTKRMKLAPLPYLLAVATASNIGSVATITGNPQNMLIGSFSRIGYRDFLWHLGPIALAGLFLDWAILYRLHLRDVKLPAGTEPSIPLPPLDLSRLTKPVIVVTAVVAEFFFGVPPDDGRVGRCVSLNHPYPRSAQGISGGRLGTAGVFRRIVSDCGWRGECRHCPQATRGG